MFNKKTFLKFMVVMAAVFCVPASQALDDFSKSYQYGGVLRAPGPDDFRASQRPILEVNSGFDAGGILGCSGLDLGAQLQNTFNVGNLGDEFKNYLQNTIATEALSLLYSQPGVSQVLDGMKAIGHARVSIQQERCNANEILADVTNKRLKDEGHARCIQERTEDECTGSVLAGYVEEISQSRRWSGTLHDHMCNDENSTVCNFMPNFAYDIGTGEGQTGQASVPPSVVGTQAEYFAEECIEMRAEQACGLLGENGYSTAMRMVAAGEARISCADGATAAAPPAAPAPDPAAPSAAPTTTDPAAGLGGGEDCKIEVNGQELDASNISAAMQAGEINPTELIESHTKCLIAKEMHGHIDIKMCLLPEDERVGVQKSLAQAISVKAAVNVYDALIQALTDAWLKSGAGQSSNADTSMNPQMQEFVRAQLDAMQAARESLMADQRLSEDVAERVAAMNNRIEELQQGVSQSGAGTFGRAAGNAQREERYYSDFFR